MCRPELGGADRAMDILNAVDRGPWGATSQADLHGDHLDFVILTYLSILLKWKLFSY